MLGTTGKEKGIHWELCKRLKFDHTTILEHEEHKILQAKRLDLVLINSKKKKVNLTSSGFYSFSGQQSENKREWKHWKILGPGPRTKKKKKKNPTNNKLWNM